VTWLEDEFADLDMDPWERAQLEEVLAEVEAEEAAGFDPGDPGDDPDEDGSWHDQLSDAASALDASRALDARRFDEDAAEALDARPPRDEVKAARALRRIEAGTYIPPPQLRPARDAEGMFSVSCGEAVDSTGRCASRYHTNPDCHVIQEAAAATGSFEEAEAWAAQLRGQPSALDVAAAQQQLGLSNEDVLDLAGEHAEPLEPLGLGDWADTFDDGRQLAYDELRDQLFHRMALRDQLPRERRPGAPDTSAIRAALGI
jgi:hypothetical protein